MAESTSLTTPSAADSLGKMDAEKGKSSSEEKATSVSSAEEPFKQSPPRQMSQLRWILIVIGILLAMFLFALDNTIVAIAQPRIVDDFGHVDLLPWISVAYALGAIAINLFLSSLFAKFDNKTLFIIGVLLFNIGSAICGASPNMTALIFGRIINGFGGVGIYVGGMNLLSVLTSEAERPMYLSIVGLSWGFGTVLGPIIGGALTDSSATWRWCFYLGLVVGGAILLVFIVLLPTHNPRKGTSLSSRIRELDWAGTLLSAGAITSLTMLIAFGGTYYDWKSGQIVALCVCAGVTWILFGLQQWSAFLTCTSDRLFPVSYLRSMEMIILFLQIALGVAVVYIPLYFIPLFFQFVKGKSALEAGVCLLPLVFFQVFGTILTGALMNKLGYYVIFYLCGGILSLTGGVLLFLTDVTTSTAAIYGYSILLGLGAGMYVQAGYPVAQLKVEASEIPKVVAFLGFGQISGITFALNLSNCIFVNLATGKLTGVLTGVSKAAVQQAITGAGGDFLARIDVEDQGQALGAILDSISRIYILVILSGALTTFLSFLMRWERIGKATKIGLKA